MTDGKNKDREEAPCGETRDRPSSPRTARRTRIFEMCVFAMLAALMLCSKLVMEFLPNIHLLGMFTMVLTLTFRKKALIPIYLYVFLNGLVAGFNLWWVPYLYIWTVLWGVTMLLPRRMPERVAAVVYPVICAAHGLAFGILYAPAEALLFGLSFKETVLWVLAGLGFDLLHMVGNVVAGLLVLPMHKLLDRLVKNRI